MRRAMTPMLAIITVAAIALLALYAMGIFDGNGVLHVEDMRYSTGGFYYNGEMKDGLFSGNGEIVLDEGDVFQGSFDEGRFFGNGTFYRDSKTDTDGWHFSGVFSEGRAGSGSFYFLDGSAVILSREQMDVTISGLDWMFSGGFSEHGGNGTGSYTFEDGSVYNGSFLNSIAHGEGEYIDAEGFLIYSGGFRNGYFDGQGVFYSRDGWIYDGGFKDGMFDGEGKVTDGDFTAVGIWERGVQIQ